MFEDLIKDDAKLNSNEENGGIKRISIGSANTNINEVDTNGSVLLDTGTEELEQADIEATTKEIDGEEVVELGSNGEPIGDSLPEYTKINPYGPTAQKWLTQEEREALQSQVDRFSEEDKESVKKVQMALQSEEYPSDINGLWKELCKEEEIFGMGEEEELSDIEKDRKMVEKMKEKGYDVEPEYAENKQVQDMTGQELASILNGEPSEEELESEPEEAEVEVEIEELEPDIRESASEAFEQRGGYWSDIAEELSIDIPNTKVESMPDGNKKKVTTTNPKMIEELKRVHESDEYDTKLHKEGDNTYVGVIPTGVQY